METDANDIDIMLWGNVSESEQDSKAWAFLYVCVCVCVKLKLPLFSVTLFLNILNCTVWDKGLAAWGEMWQDASNLEGNLDF